MPTAPDRLREAGRSENRLVGLVRREDVLWLSLHVDDADLQASGTARVARG